MCSVYGYLKTWTHRMRLYLYAIIAFFLLIELVLQFWPNVGTPLSCCYACACRIWWDHGVLLLGFPPMDENLHDTVACFHPLAGLWCNNKHWALHIARKICISSPSKGSMLVKNQQRDLEESYETRGWETIQSCTHNVPNANEIHFFGKWTLGRWTPFDL